MLVKVFSRNDLLEEAFYNHLEQPYDMGLDVISASPTRLVIRNTATGVTTTFTGRDLPSAAQLENESFPGAITGWSSVNSAGNPVATVTGINWLFYSFVQGLDQMFSQEETPILDTLFNAQRITLDASGSPTYQPDLSLDGLTTGGTIIGSQFSDTMIGGLGNDTINPGATESGGFDLIYASAGSDRYVFSDVTSTSYAELAYGTLRNPITVTVNGTNNTGSITSGGATDTLVDVRKIMQADGLSIVGTRGNDTFNLNPGSNGWIVASGGAGVDTYNVTLSGTVRLSFNGYFAGEDDWQTPTRGVDIDLRSGRVNNDGFGNAEQINITNGTGRLEIRGTVHADRIIGSDRNESFRLDGGNDTLDGGGGNDRVRYDNANYSAVTVDLVAGTATGTWRGQSFRHTLSNIEEVRGGSGNDRLVGNGGNNYLEGRDGNDTLVSGAGNDTLYGGNGADTFVISAGGQTRIGDFNVAEDRIDLSGWAGLTAISQLTITSNPAGGLVVTHGAERLEIISSGGALAADALTSQVLSGLSNETEPLPSRNDTPQEGDIVGTPNTNEVLTGTDDDDRIFGGSGNNRLEGGSGNDTLYAGTGNDTLDGGSGSNVLVGNTGNDRFIVRNPGDLVINELGYSQQGGINTVEAWVDFTLPRNIQILRLQGTENLNGNGGWAPEALVGNTGNNVLDGGHGNDVLNGKAGDDTLIGGMGADSLVGEAGADVFLFRSIEESRPGQENRDFINGFFRAEGDRIDLSQIDANTTQAGNQAFTFVGTRAFSGTAGELRWFTWGGGNFNLVEADVNGDRVADFQIFVNLTNTMQASDFIL